MSNDMHWGGINGKSLCKAVISDIWMVFAVMVIAYLGIGMAGRMMYTPSYTSSSVVAVYPFNQIYTLETSSSALATVSAANEVINSEMFSTGVKERLNEPEDFSLYSRQIDGTYILMLSASSSSRENAYKTLRTALDYYEEISSNLVGNNQLEILSEPDFPVSASNDSRILKYRLLLTLFSGFATGCILVLMYAMRKTYKTTSAIRKYYNNVQFFTIEASASDKHRSENKKESAGVPNQEAAKKTALILLQMLRAKNDKSILVTSAAPNEGKTEITCALAREMAGFGKSVMIMAIDPADAERQELIDMADNRQGYALSDLLQDGVKLESVAADIPDKSVKIIFANKINEQEEFFYTAKDVERFLEEVEKLADVILVDGCVWTGTRDELIWKNAVDLPLAVCRQDKADFYAIDRMMTDLREDKRPREEKRRARSQSDSLGCVLYGF